MSEYCDFEWNHRHFGQRSATEHLKKDNNINWNESTNRTNAVRQLKERIEASIDYALKDKSCCQDDDFLLRFLYARKFNIDDSFQLVISYFNYRQKNAVVFQKISALDESIILSLRDGFPGVLKGRDRRGRKVLIFIAGSWDYSTYSLITVYRAMLLSLEKLLENKQNQANGFLVIVDWTNFTLRQSSHLNPKVLKLMIEGLQDCFPARFKEIHFIGQPWYVETVFTLIRPFLKEKTRERIKLHGGNLSTLHECITRDILPPELGGDGPTYNPLDWYHTLLESSQTITPCKTYYYTSLCTKTSLMNNNTSD